MSGPHPALMSTGQDCWETPPKLFDELDSVFHFTLDPCATASNAKCQQYFDESKNGLEKDWQGQVVFCNPPYSRMGNQDAWVKKCREEGQKPETTVVALLPARTDTQRFHRDVIGFARVRFIEGRICFYLGGNPILDSRGKPSPAPFPSMICVWGGPEILPGYIELRRD